MPYKNANEEFLRSVIPGQIASVTSRVKVSEVSELTNAILEAETIFVAGAGRSLLMLKAFAMRLVHLGLRAYVVGETSTPAIDEDDLLIAASGSGITRTTMTIVEAAKERGAKTVVITANPTAPVPQNADMLVEIPWPLTKISDDELSPQPPGSLFEQTLLVVCEDMVMHLMKALGTTPREMRARHTKLE